MCCPVNALAEGVRNNARGPVQLYSEFWSLVMEQTVSLNVVETSCNNGLVVRRSWNGNVGELWGVREKAN